MNYLENMSKLKRIKKLIKELDNEKIGIKYMLSSYALTFFALIVNSLVNFEMGASSFIVTLFTIPLFLIFGFGLLQNRKLKNKLNKFSVYLLSNHLFLDTSKLKELDSLIDSFGKEQVIMLKSFIEDVHQSNYACMKSVFKGEFDIKYSKNEKYTISDFKIHCKVLKELEVEYYENRFEIVPDLLTCLIEDMTKKIFFEEKSEIIKIIDSLDITLNEKSKLIGITARKLDFYKKAEEEEVTMNKNINKIMITDSIENNKIQFKNNKVVIKNI
jgi:hypothetical protein